MRRPWTFCLLGLSLVACKELPTAVGVGGQEEPPALTAGLVPTPVTAPTLACTKTWTSGGWPHDWNDSDNWTPVGAPRPSDVACVLNGTLLDVHDSVRVRSLEVGGQASVTFHENVLWVQDTILVRGRLDIDSSTDVDLGMLINHGALWADRTVIEGNLENHGDLYLGYVGPMQWIGARIVNSGGGTVSSSPFDPSTMSGDLIEWDGAGTYARLRAGVLLLGSTNLSGTFYLERGDTVFGDIGADVALRLGVQGVTGQQYAFRKSRTALSGTVLNEGDIEVEDSQARPVFLDLSPVFEQRGELEVRSPTTVVAGRIVNRGLIYAPYGGLDVESGIVNEGEISGASTLTMMPGSAFEARPGSTMTGSLTLLSATLRGTGGLGSVTAVNTIIAPGTTNAPHGTLTFNTLELDALSRVDLEVADTTAGGFDQLAVANAVQLFGDLRVTTAPGLQGGSCGQVVPLITGEVSGQFQTTSLPSPIGPRAWRLHVGAQGVDLVGYRPGSPFTLDAAALTVEEGGPPVSYRMCLGAAAPTASVQVLPVSRAGEVSIRAAVTFDPADWMLPRTVSVMAVDDADVEGTHADTLGHAVTSTDPTYRNAVVPRLPVTLFDNDEAADLTLVKVAQQDNQFLGDTMSTSFRVTNAGPSPATQVRVTSLPLVGLELVDATGATCSVRGGGALECALGTLDPGFQAEFVVRFRGAAVGLHTNTLSVGGGQPDPNLTDNTVVYTQRVN
ncbi:MAG: DUF11 domain-containing protein [Gemmatimonadota bacterium]